MSYPLNYPTPQNANVQIFNANPSTKYQSWVKPQGASFVWLTLIGGGSPGNATSGGGASGSVTNFMCPAFLIPDALMINVGNSASAGNAGNPTTIVYRTKDATYTLLSAFSSASDGSGAGAMTANYFTAMGFFQSVAGVIGDTNPITAPSTLFLTGGTTSGSGVTGNYGYTIGSTTSKPGIFQMQPIINGLGGMGTSDGGIGCGGGGSSPYGAGGAGLCVIITW